MSARRISVITVVRNGAECIAETIESVLRHKEEVDLDYLLVDGGSTDGTLDIVRGYADRLYYFVSEPDGGIYHAMNKGWAAARGDSMILYLGAGDRLLSLPKSIVERPRAMDEVLYGDVEMGEHRLFKGGAGFRLRLYNTLHHQALLVDKRYHPAPPFDIRFGVYADFDFNQRLLKRGARFTYSPGFRTYARPGGVSDQPDFDESLRVIRHNFGTGWAFLAWLSRQAIKAFPFLNGLRPFQEI